MAKQSQRLVLMLIIGILIGTAGVMAWKTRIAGEGEEATMNTTISNATTSSDSLIKEDESISHAVALPLSPSIPKGDRLGISVEDQNAGTVVRVSGLNVNENKWIAVYDDRENQPGYIMGAVRIHPSESSAEVELLRPTVKGEKYYVGILNDDGDENFNRQTDLPPLSPDKVIIVSFNAI